jgi:xanthine/CO dehydrogenase XdhC/CoxF family maturation factor
MTHPLQQGQRQLPFPDTMRELLLDVDRWHAQGKAIALATVVHTWGSSPRPVGAQMAISSAGEMSGSVSGGCVEGAVAQVALAVLADGRPVLVEYGIADELAQSVGLACGGRIEVFVEPFAVDAASGEAQLTRVAP